MSNSDSPPEPVREPKRLPPPDLGPDSDGPITPFGGPMIPPGAQLPEGFVIDLPPELEFTPVPRQRRRNSLYAERQRLFIALLMSTGSVIQACRMLGCQSDAIYNLRSSAGAESFAAAWDKAVKMGAHCVLHTFMDHSINGVPEIIYGPDGQVIAERRRFNTRAQMWLIAHYFPKRFAVTGGLMHRIRGGKLGSGAAPSNSALKKLKAKWRAKWEKQLLKSVRKAEAKEARARMPDSDEMKRFRGSIASRWRWNAVPACPAASFQPILSCASSLT